jgi:hypothetical protein
MSLLAIPSCSISLSQKQLRKLLSLYNRPCGCITFSGGSYAHDDAGSASCSGLHSAGIGDPLQHTFPIARAIQERANSASRAQHANPGPAFALHQHVAFPPSLTLAPGRSFPPGRTGTGPGGPICPSPFCDRGRSLLRQVSRPVPPARSRPARACTSRRQPVRLRVVRPRQPALGRGTVRAQLLPLARAGWPCA